MGATQKNDRVVVVTGGSSGIGRAMAEAFVRNNDQVVILGRREDALRAAAEAIGALGGAQNGHWLGPDETAQLLVGNERYRLYNGVTNLGEARGSRPVTESANPCGGWHVITLTPSPQVQPAIAIGGTWDLLPRQPQALSLESVVYREAMADWLRSHGIDQPDVQLTGVQRIDLEGDGVDEVLVSATRLKDAGHTPSVGTGDYSVVVVRKLVADTVVTLPLVADYYRQTKELAYPATHAIATLLDVNGDGTQEVVVQSTAWEGMTTSIYAVHAGMAQQVGSACDLGATCDSVGRDPIPIVALLCPRQPANTTHNSHTNSHMHPHAAEQSVL